MVLVTGNWRAWLMATAASLLIFGVLYFTVIKPDNNTAQQALKSGLQQSQQVLNQTKKDLSNTAGQGGQASSQAKSVVSKAQKLTACVAAAGTDVSKVQACQTKFGG